MAGSESLKPPARLLLVEGPTDKQVVRNLRKRFRGERSIPAFDIREMGGVDNLLSVIEAEVDVPGRKALGILVDANNAPADRWSAVTERLRRARQDMKPGDPVREGTVIGGSPDVGFLAVARQPVTWRARGFRCTDDSERRSGMAVVQEIH